MEHRGIEEKRNQQGCQIATQTGHRNRNLLDGAGAVDGLKRSFAVVKANVGPVLGFLVGIIIVAVGAAIVGLIVRGVPLLGALAQAAINGALVSYVTVVGVRLYQALPRS